MRSTNDFKPTFYEIRLPNKDIKVVVNYAYDSDCHFLDCFSHISETYTGLRCDCFINDLRGLLSRMPLFFENVSESDYRNDFAKMGINETTAPERMKRIYQTI